MSQLLAIGFIALGLIFDCTGFSRIQRKTSTIENVSYQLAF